MDTTLPRFKVFYSSSVLALRVSALVNLVLLAAVGLLSWNLYATRAQIASFKPLVIRVDQAGRAVPVDLTVSNDPATELEVKVFASQYVTNIASYDPYTLNRDLGLALRCTDEACGKQLVSYFQNDPQMKKLAQSRSVIQTHVTAVQILRTHPYEVRVEYTTENLQTGQQRTWYALLSLKDCPRSFDDPFGLLVTGVRLNTTIQ
ncbi:MAG: VirB8/TrbF family protein [Halothiobacillaceae bacterium]